MRGVRRALIAACLLASGPSLAGQEPAPAGADAKVKGRSKAAAPAEAAGAGTAAAEAPSAAPAFDPAAAVQGGCAILLECQEGEGRREWPYEGVYREREPGQALPVIPFGYRVGGTAIAALALLAAPGYGDADHEPRRLAVARGLDFVLESLDHPLMAPRREDDYDVRGWGFIYALQLCASSSAEDWCPRGGRKPSPRPPSAWSPRCATPRSHAAAGTTLSSARPRPS